MTTILFVTANPFCVEWDAEADRELQVIRRELRRSLHRDSIELVELVAAEAGELDQYLVQYKPDILHLAVPALPDVGLYFQELENREQQARVDDAISGKVAPSITASYRDNGLARVLQVNQASGNLKLLVVNSPLDLRVARQLCAHAPHVIAMPDIVNQDVCVQFSKSFYGSIAAGAGIQRSFNVAKAAVERLLPQLSFGQVVPYWERDEYKAIDIDVSNRVIGPSRSKKPYRIMLWSTVPTAQRYRGTLNISGEVRKIERKLLQSPGRDEWSLVTEWAVRADEVAEHLLSCDPAVLIISGHAGRDGVWINAERGRRLLPTSELVDYLQSAAKNIRCVVLNGCNTSAMMEDVARVAGFAIGTTALVPDDAAIAFSEQFVMALSHDRSLAQAFDIAKAASTHRHGLHRDIESAEGAAAAASYYSAVAAPGNSTIYTPLAQLIAAAPSASQTY